MIARDSSTGASFSGQAGVDMLDGLRLEYIAGVLRFFTGASEIRVSGDFSDGYDEVTVLVDSCVRKADVEDAVEQVAGNEVSATEDCGGFCCRFSLGQGDDSTEFRVVCSEDSLDEDVELYGI